MRISIWALSFVAIGGLIIGIISKIPMCLIIFPYLAFFKDSDLFTFSAVLIAAVSILNQSYQSKMAKKTDSSKFYLNKYIKACNMVLRRIKADTPTRRIAWVSAASIANKAQKIEQKITEQVDKDFLEIYQRDFFHQLTDFLHTKPAIYYYDADCDAPDDRDKETQALNCAYMKSYKNQFNSSTGSIPRVKGVCYVDEKHVVNILSLIKPILEKEAGIICNDENEFLNVVKMNYPDLYLYMAHLKNCISNPKVGETLFSAVAEHQLSP